MASNSEGYPFWRGSRWGGLNSRGNGGDHPGSHLRTLAAVASLRGTYR